MSNIRNNDNPLLVALKASRNETLKSMMVGMPGRVLSYDPSKQRAQVECGIQRSLGNDTYVTLPIIENVPVRFSGTAEWLVFHELPTGTEGFIHFSQRAIDNWLSRGGPVPPSDSRLLSLTDAFFSPGYRSAVTSIAGLPTSGIGLSNKDGSVLIHLTDTGIKLSVGDQVLELTASGLICNVANVTNNGTTTLNAKTEIPNGGLSIAGVEHDNHKHGGVQRGEGISDGPQ